MKLGILGGGQLGQMMTQAMIPLGVECHVLDANPEASCRFFRGFAVGDVQDAQTVFDWGKQFDRVTFEWEHVSVEGLERLEQAGVVVAPSSKVLRTIQDKGIQKQWYADLGVPTAPWILIDGPSQVPSDWAFPCIQKSRRGGYDGKGVQKVDRVEGLWPVPSVLESLIAIDKEISVLVVRGHDGAVVTYDPVEMWFDPHANLIDKLVSPAQISHEVEATAKTLAVKLAHDLEHVGVLAVEMFVTKSGEVLVNEVAPRPHNSGHHTIEACYVSQFENHIRAVLGWPLGSPSLRVPAACMVNVLAQGQGSVNLRGLDALLQVEGTHLHLYGKPAAKPGRKMGHITCTGSSLDDVVQKSTIVQSLFSLHGV